MVQGYKLTSARADYMTPPEVIAKILKMENIEEFDLDTCCATYNIPAKEHYVAEVNMNTGEVIRILDDGLRLPWKKLNWCNPPFNQADKWIKKALEEQRKGNSTWLILPFRAETKYWDFVLCQTATIQNRIIENERIYCEILKKGLGFIHPQTEQIAGVYKYPLAIVKIKGVQEGQCQLTFQDIQEKV